MEVDGNRLRQDIEANAEFGRIKSESGRGRTVLTGSPADERARNRLLERFDAAGLDTLIDPVGNIVGRWVPETADPDAPPVVAGSHLDSVPRGGIFDGPLGVYAALEAVRTIQESNSEPQHPLEVVCFTEEEGTRFDVGLLGSSVATGERSVAAALALEDSEGQTLESHLERIGFRGEDRIDAGEWEAFLELHVEQSTALESAGKQAGVVTTITGLEQYAVEFVGESDHAGGTRMDDRRDALVAASEFVTAIDRIAREQTTTESAFAVATVGSLDVSPNATNVVPGRVTAGLDVRDTDQRVIDRIVERARETLGRLEASHGVETTIQRQHATPPAPMSERCQNAFQTAVERHGIPSMRLPSGGGHDAMNVARVTDAGLLFAPSVGGVSHSPQEWTDWEDCRACTQLLTTALAELTDAQ